MAGNNYTSRRGYLSQAELAELADITITDTDEADDQISQAEEMIDAYVGFQNKFIRGVLTRRASGGTSNTLTLHTDDQNVVDVDYYKGCEVEIIGGTGVGQRRIISGSTRAGVITVSSNWTTTPDSTSFYKIYQLGKFPRPQDVTYYSQESPFTYYKSIPEAVKRAVAAQVEYVINMGEAFFTTDKSDKQSENIGDYGYSRANNAGGQIGRMIAPKAKAFLSGIMNRTGELIP